MYREQDYVCPTCGATKKIIDRFGVTQFPNKVVCGWRGCKDYALPESKGH